MVKILNEPVLKKTWPTIEEYLFIRNKQDYDNAVSILNHLLDEVGENRNHPLFGFIEILGIMIEDYEEKHYSWENTSGISVLKFLMEEHNLKQEELPEIGSQGVVSEILNGKRQLNVNQIKKLGDKFHVSPTVFL